MDDTKDKVTISRRDLYCIARQLQSEKYAHEPFKACQYCKYPCSTEDELLPNYERVQFRLQDLTGVDFGVGPKSIEKNDFPTKKPQYCGLRLLKHWDECVRTHERGAIYGSHYWKADKRHTSWLEGKNYVDKDKNRKVLQPRQG